MKKFNSFIKHIFNKKYNTAELNIAWLYYQQLLNLRLKYSQFYILLSTFLVGGFLTIFQIDTSIHSFVRSMIGLFIGALLGIFSIAFMQIDKRNKECREHVKKIIEEIEREESYPKHLKLSKMIEIGDHPTSKTHSLSKFIYFTFLVIGVLFAIGSLASMVLNGADFFTMLM